MGNPKAEGLPRAETSVDYHDLSAYLEGAYNPQLSAFVEIPVRFLDPEINTHTAGLADMNAGLKWAFLYEEDQRIATFQLRTYIPTGASTHGLGTDHVSLEPALLLFYRLSDHFIFESELRDWVPIGGTNFEGNVIRYGGGLSYLAYDRPGLRISPVIEVVGWTCLNGKETVPLGNNVFDIREAGGDTIVNAKFGLRVLAAQHSNLYVGYGRALTSDVWYKDIIRVEYRLAF